jgi:hypothetical protein
MCVFAVYLFVWFIYFIIFVYITTKYYLFIYHVITFVLEEGRLRRRPFLPTKRIVLNSNTYDGKIHTLNEFRLKTSYVHVNSRCFTVLYKCMAVVVMRVSYFILDTEMH